MGNEIPELQRIIREREDRIRRVENFAEISLINDWADDDFEEWEGEMNDVPR